MKARDVTPGEVTPGRDGSEAVDLALRIARFATGGEGTVITANAYHGVTTAAAEDVASLGPAVGGNSVSIAAAAAVLDVIETEGTV